jgi:ATPase subunit of ABC transporter with duplicated ATPase domains
MTGFIVDLKLITVDDVDYAYDEKAEGLLFQKVQFNVSSQSRLAILGKNGCGKVSFFKSSLIIANELYLALDNIASVADW